MILPATGRGPLLIAVIVVVLSTASFANAAADSASTNEQNVTIVEYDLHDRMARDDSYSPTVTVENAGDEPVALLIEYEFDGEPHVGFEEDFQPGETRQTEFWRITLEEIEEFRMRDVDAGTYEHRVIVYVEDQNGYLVEADAVEETVEVLESATDDEAERTTASESTADARSDEREPLETSSDADGVEAAAGPDPADDEPTRGFLSNDPDSSLAMLDDPAALTWVGILVSIVGIVVQLGWRQ